MERLTTYILTVVIVVGLMLLWTGIQALWRRVFAAYIQEADVLAERRSCGNCGCTKACENKKIENVKD